MNQTSRNSKSPNNAPIYWILGALFTLCAVALAGVLWTGLRAFETMADPEARREQALAFMENDALPEGYETAAALNVPFLTDVVVLHGPRSQFVYLNRLHTDADLVAALVDEESYRREIRQAGFTIPEETIVVPRFVRRQGGAEWHAMLVEGVLEFDITSSSIFDFDFGEIFTSEDDVDAELSALILMRCAPDERPRLGMWTGPRPSDPNAEGDDAERSGEEGGPGDLQAEYEFLQGLTEELKLCASNAGGAAGEKPRVAVAGATSPQRPSDQASVVEPIPR